MLVINADDYGYAPSYDAGIVAAARAGAIDGASVMAMRTPEPGPLMETGVAIGLHLEAERSPAEQSGALRSPRRSCRRRSPHGSKGPRRALA